MKTILILLAFSLSSCSYTPTQNGPSYQTVLAKQTPDPLMQEIQSKIYNAFVGAMATQDEKNLKDIEQQLSSLYQEQPRNIIRYWQAYQQFYKSIFLLQSSQQKEAEKAIDKAIKWLKDMDQKNSEDYALLSMLHGFSIQFKSGIRAAFIGNSAAKDAAQAVELDSTNLRAWFVTASNDYYTPKKYGGGKKTEHSLLKALACADQAIENPYLPSWGREESYEMLIRFFIREERWEDAKRYFAEAKEHFPESYTINQLASKLIGK